MSNYLKISFCTLLIIFMSCKSDDSSGSSTKPNSGGSIIVLNNYGGSQNDSYTSVAATTDGGYIITGYTQSIDGDISDKTIAEFDYWVVKYSSNDIIEWSKTYGGSSDDRANQIIQTIDGGYAVIGYSKSNDLDVSSNEGLKDFWMLKLNNLGSISWEKNFGFTGEDKGITVIQTTDGGYLLGGTIDVSASGGLGNDRNASVNHAGGDYWAIKLDASGTKEWRKYYGGGLTDKLQTIVQTNDGGFLFMGESDSVDVDITNNKGEEDFWLVKVNSIGVIIWEKSYGGSQIDIGFGITKTIDGNYVIVGDTRSSDGDIASTNGNADIWALKIDDNGTIIWEKTYGGTNFDTSRAVICTTDGGFFITGSSRSIDGDATTNNGQNDVWIIKTKANGSLEWQKSVGGTQIDFGYGLTQLQNGDILVVGDTTSDDLDFPNNKGFKDALIIRIN